jgi:hypothetical protein
VIVGENAGDMTGIITEYSDGIEVRDFFGFADLEAAKDLRPMQRGIQDMSEPGRSGR